MRDPRIRRGETPDPRSRAIPNEKRTKTRKVGDSVSKRDDGGKQEDDLSRGRARAGDADHLAALLLREISRARGEGAGRGQFVLVETIDAADWIWSDARDSVSDGVVTADNGATDGRRVIEYVCRMQVPAFAQSGRDARASGIRHVQFRFRRDNYLFRFLWSRVRAATFGEGTVTEWRSDIL